MDIKNIKKEVISTMDSDYYKKILLQMVKENIKNMPRIFGMYFFNSTHPQTKEMDLQLLKFIDELKQTKKFFENIGEVLTMYYISMAFNFEEKYRYWLNNVSNTKELILNIMNHPFTVAGRYALSKEDWLEAFNCHMLEYISNNSHIEANIQRLKNMININPNFFRELDVCHNFRDVLFRSDIIDVFGLEFLANANLNQKKIIGEVYQMNNLKKIKEILLLNPNVNCNTEFFNNEFLIGKFSAEEIATMSENKMKAYVLAYSLKKINILDKIYEINPCFVIYDFELLKYCSVKIAFLPEERQKSLANSITDGEDIQENFSSSNLRLRSKLFGKKYHKS